MKWKTIATLAGPALLAMMAGTAAAQVTGATLTGKVTDSNGAVVPSASIEVVRVSTDTHRNAKSNDAGTYAVPNLNPGTYTITVTAASFGTEVLKDVDLAVGQTLEQNFALKAGQVTEQVVVTDQAPPLDTSSSQVQNVIDSTTVRELPLSTRDWTLLSTLEPGVALVRTEKAVAVGADRGNRGFGAQLTIAGGRPQQNNYRMDGISMNDYSNGAPGSVSGENLGVDAIQEFSVVTANASAEYGREAGGVINAVSRAGTNQLHGTVFEFLRNDRLDANTYYFNPGTALEPEQELRKNQFGGALGGPIFKDKLFFFGNYEGIRLIQGLPFTVNAPSANARNGILACSTATGGVQQAGCPTPGPAAAGFTYTVPVSADVKSYLAFWNPTNITTTATSNPDVVTYAFYGRQVQPENFVQGRLDQVFSAKDSAHEMYMYDDGNFTQPDSLSNYSLLSHTNRQLGLIEETHVFSAAFVNTARMGVSRNVANITNTAAGTTAAAADTSLGGVPGRTASSVVVGGLTTFGGGLNAPSQYNFYWTSTQFYDDAFYTVRKHTLRFGVALENMHNNIVATSSPAGLYTFGSAPDFIAGRVQAFSAQLPGSAPEKGLIQWLAGGYVLDDWKALPNLTLNLGVRYEVTTVPTERHDLLSTLRNLTDAAPHLGDPYFSNPTLRNVEPRVGLVWDPLSNGKTVVRSGFGVFDVLPLPYQFELLSALAAPYLQVGNVTYSNVSAPYATAQPGDGKFAHGAFGAIQAPSTLRQSYVQPAPARSYLMEWNLNVEHSLGKDFSMYLGFVGSKGVHQPFRSDEVNTVQPVSYDNYYQPRFPKPGTAAVLNPNVGQIAAIFYNNNTFYDGLQASLSKKMSHGLQFQASYTYSKALDSGSAILAGDPFGNSISGLFYFAPQTRFGPADFNVPNIFTFNYLYRVPKLKSLHGVADSAVNGWELSGIYFASNGLPFTPTITGDQLGLKGTAPYDVPNRVPGCNLHVARPIGGLHDIPASCFTFPTANADGTNTLGNASRNLLHGPNLNSLDFSLSKMTTLTSSDRVRLQFRAEAYNLLNHPNFSPPIGNKTLFTAGSGAQVGTYGNITATVIPMRQLQFGVKLLF